MKKITRRLKKCVRLIRTICEILFAKHGQRFFLIGSPLHGNIGDHAISIAERALFREVFPRASVVEIAGVDLKYFKGWLPKIVRAEDYILITGGGFMGNLWLNEEEMIRQVILSFPRNPIWILPQTVYYSSDKEGQTELAKSKQIYGTHNNLHILLRERQSYIFVRENFSKLRSSECVPDMAMYLNLAKPSIKRKGILICFREDKEKIYDKMQLQQLIDKLHEKYGEVTTTTTVLDREIMFEERNKIFLEKIREFQHSRLVITDRLHGMIFAAITGTPCIAMNNVSGKVRGVYAWIADLGYIQFVETTDAVIDCAERLFQMENCKYDNSKLKNCLCETMERMKNVRER